MALVRCPKHDMPYNDRNPRGCPVCAHEREGAEQVGLMRDLARASRGGPRVEILPPPEPDARRSARWPPPVTQPPRIPTAEPTTGEKLRHFLRTNIMAVTAAILGVIGLWLLWYISRPTFVADPIPPHIVGDALPFPVQPNVPVVGAFALVGAVPPEVNPDSPTLARYDYGRGTTVDVLNGVVYAITLSSPERAWNGNRVGLDETRAKGELALLGTIVERRRAPLGATTVGSYVAYRSVEALPRRVLTAAVRPPNGCYDVEIDLAPQVLGRVTRGGDETFLAVARRGGAAREVVHQVRVVSRALPGPYAGPPVCPTRPAAPPPQTREP
jgi:hypothetical protein